MQEEKNNKKSTILIAWGQDKLIKSWAYTHWDNEPHHIHHKF